MIILQRQEFMVNCLIFFFLFSSSAIAEPTQPNVSELECARTQSDLAEKSRSSSQKRKLSLQGLHCADECLRKDNNNTACFYYRAVNRGHILDLQLVPSAENIRKMIVDFKKVVEHEPRFDHAGALRALGEVYLQLPRLPLYGKDLTQDLELARHYADEAVRLAPEEPENTKLAEQIRKKREGE